MHIHITDIRLYLSQQLTPSKKKKDGSDIQKAIM